MHLNITGTNMPIKVATKTIDFVKQMALLEMYDTKDTHAFGVLDTQTNSFVNNKDINTIEHIIKSTPQRFITTSSFGIQVSLNNGTYNLTFIKHKKGCSLWGDCDIQTRNRITEMDKQQALNDYMWGIYVSETIETHLLPSIKIDDDTNYHKSKPNRETLKQWKFNDTNRGTTYLKDFNNLDNHDLTHLLLQLNWSQSLIAKPMNSGNSARMNMLMNTLTDMPNEYGYITHIRKLCDMAIAYING